MDPVLCLAASGVREVGGVLGVAQVAVEKLRNLVQTVGRIRASGSSAAQHGLRRSGGSAVGGGGGGGGGGMVLLEDE